MTIVTQILKGRDNSKSSGIADTANYADKEILFHVEKLGGIFSINMPIPFKDDERFGERYELYRRFDANPWDEMAKSAENIFRPRTENNSLTFDITSANNNSNTGIANQERHFPMRLTSYYFIKDDIPYLD